MGKVALCASEESLAYPKALGLEDVRVESLPWLQTFTQGCALRAALAEGQPLEEIWMVSADDVSTINLAAALRKDGFTGVICMVVDDASGSSLSRSMVAGVNEAYNLEQFVQRFSVEAMRRQRMMEVANGINVVGLDRPMAGPKEPAAFSGNPRTGASKESRPVLPVTSSGTGRLIAVMGASGGVGKSTVAACLAATAAARGMKVLMLDADLQFGCLHRMFGVQQPITFDDVTADGRALAQLATTIKKGTPAVLGAPLRLEHSEALVGSVAAVASEASSLFDVVIADTGASWSEAHASLLEMATCTLFVIDQRSESVRACQHALDLCGRMGLATGSFAFTLNRCSKEAPFTSADVSCAMNGAHIHELEDGGSEIEELCGCGMAASLATAGNAFAKSIDALAREVMPEVFGEPHEHHEGERLGGWFRVFGQRRERQRRRQRKGNEIVVQPGPPHPEFQSAKQAWESL